MQTDIWQPFNLVTFSPSSSSPSEHLVATHPLEEQQGFAFLPCADPVLANYLQSMHQSCANPHIWCNQAGYGKPGPPEPSNRGPCVVCVRVCVKRERRNVTQHKGGIYNGTDIVWIWAILNVTVVPDVAICVSGKREKWGVRSPTHASW